LDIYDAAGMPKPTLTDLNPDFIARTQQADNPHLALGRCASCSTRSRRPRVTPAAASALCRVVSARSGATAAGGALDLV